MKNLIIAGLLLVSANATASVITQEVSFGTQGSHVDVAIGALDETLFVDSFDTSLGNLTAVNITVASQMDSIGSSQNQSEADGRAEVGITLFQDWKVTTSAAEDYIFKGASFTPYLGDSSSPVDTYTLITGTDNDTFNYNLSSGELHTTLTNVDIEAFKTGEDIGFNFSGFVQTTITNSVESGTGYFLNSFQTGSWGQVEVEYVYTSKAEVVSREVPEPATAGVFALGTLLLGARRFKKK
jgi:hypothetical protein